MAKEVPEPFAGKMISPELVAAKMIRASASAKDDLLPDPLKLAIVTPPGIAEPVEDDGVPLRPQHPKDFHRPSQYGGRRASSSIWASANRAGKYC